MECEGKKAHRPSKFGPRRTVAGARGAWVIGMLLPCLVVPLAPQVGCEQRPGDVGRTGGSVQHSRSSNALDDLQSPPVHQAHRRQLPVSQVRQADDRNARRRQQGAPQQGRAVSGVAGVRRRVPAEIWLQDSADGGEVTGSGSGAGHANNFARGAIRTWNDGRANSSRTLSIPEGGGNLASSWARSRGGGGGDGDNTCSDKKDFGHAASTPEVDASPCTPAADALGAGGFQLKENNRFPTSALDSLDLDATCTETRTAADADMLSKVAQEGRESEVNHSNSVDMFKPDKGVAEDTRRGQEKWGSVSSANGTIPECVAERGADVLSSLCAVGVERGGDQRQQEAEREGGQVRQGAALHLLQPSAQSPVERGRRRLDEGGGGGGGGGGEGSTYRRGRDMLRSPASVRSQAPSAFGPPGNRFQDLFANARSVLRP
jgi:hypothetical protein